jgi:serine/threonine-protein kinase
MSRGEQADRPLGHGARVGVYEILDRLGAGGMGEVWLARDTRLGRKVALKTLLAEFAGDEERRRRFEEEARTVAALNHPNIVTLHSVEHEDGVRFLTMEYVQGKTLDALIPAGGLDARTFFDLAVPLTEAVAVAHRRNIAHRDLKPGNVMVTGDGRVKVVDFGLATDRGLVEVDSPSSIADQTQEGMLVGTVPYMSPEQLRGKRADRCSDVFALGVVLYEMLTGRRPFDGSGLADLASSILRDDPPPVGSLRSDLPDGLWTLLARCLEKERALRPASADVVLPELVKARQQFVSGRLGGAVMLEGRGDDVNRRVAVLEFTNIANDPEVEWIATGIAETLTVDLNKVRGVTGVALPACRTPYPLAHSMVCSLMTATLTPGTS